MTGAKIHQSVALGGYYAGCADCNWRQPVRDSRTAAWNDANGHNLTHHLPDWLYA